MSKKIRRLFTEWPQGTVATLVWLSTLGISRKLANWHVGSGWLKQLGPRAFVRPGDHVDWRGGLYALQTQLHLTVHVGGRTALDMQGMGHFLSLGQSPSILLFSDRKERLPSWFTRNPWPEHILHCDYSLFAKPSDATLSPLDCGAFRVLGAAPERAIMEAIHLVRDNGSLDDVYALMRGLTTLRPALVQQLLETCQSVKVKRIFLWSADRLEHPWFKRLDLSRVDLGKGKRLVYRKGVFDPKYRITVPPPERLPDV